MTHNINKQSYVSGIDGLRAFAVLAVVIFHISPHIFPGGFCGVDIFFVISGFVVSSSLSKYKDAPFISFAIGFYARRLIRIYPALILCLSITILLQTLLIPSAWLSNTSIKTGISAFFGLSNIALISLNDGYFSPRVEFNAFTHTWSLAVEEQFYLIFPVVFYIWLSKNNFFGLMAWLSKALLPMLFVISLIFSAYETNQFPDRAYYLLPSRFWELASGALLYIAHTKNISSLTFIKSNSNLIFVLGFVLLLIGIQYTDPELFPFPGAMLSVLGTILAITSLLVQKENRSYAMSIIDNRVMIGIGKASYSLYIWHWPILVIFKWTVGIENSAYLFVMIFITIVMGLLSYHVIELPSRNFLSKFPLSSSRIFVMGVISIVGFAIIAALLSATQPYVSLSVTRDRQLWYPESWPSAFRNDTTTSQKYIVRTIFVFGDSHASSYSTLLKELSDETGVSVRQYSKGGCPVANFLTIPSIDCRHFIENTLAEIEKYSKPGDIVFLASLRMNRLSDQWKTFDIAAVEARQNGVAATKQRATALLEADQLVNFLTKLSLNVIIDAPKPVFLSPPFRCSDWFNHMNSVCRHGFKIKRSYLLKQREPVMYSIYSLKEKYSTLFIWDTFPVLCSTDICSAFDNENPLFFDGDHLSAHGNRILIPSFSSILSIIWWPS